MRPMFGYAHVVLALGMTFHGCGRADLARKQAAPTPDGIPVGTKAPDSVGQSAFVTSGAANRPSRLSDFRGKVVMLHFWRTT